MNLTEEQYLAHYGILRRSGRYPWGSGGPEHAGKTQAIRNKTFLNYVDDLRKQGLTETEIARGMGISTTELRAVNSIAKNQIRAANISMAERLKAKGYSNPAIAERMGLAGESSVRALLASGAKDRADILTSTSNMLRKEVEGKKYVDIGIGAELNIAPGGVENRIGVSKERLNTAVAMLKEEGYQVHHIKIPTVGTGKTVPHKILVAPETTWKEVQQNRDQIQQIGPKSDNGGLTFGGMKKHAPVSIDPGRVKVRYAEDGGNEADGVIFVRPGVEDVSLGKNRYAQVRVMVGDSHYLKGMAMYKDDLPEGTDLVFNTVKSKKETANKLDVMKPMKADTDLPFGAVTRQLIVNPGAPDEHVKSAMNIVNEEGDWDPWSKTLSSQMLSKQNPSLAKTQLNMTYERRKQELADIKALTNPVVRRKMLESYADDTDAAAVDLKAAALPRQASYAILPIASMPPTQVYAPKYDNGERVVLIRHPHGGTFEIPELIVNNRNPEARKMLERGGRVPIDAIGIHHSVAERLSGADFDGDTVLVIPNPRGDIKKTPALKELQNFNHRILYKKYEGMPVLSKSREQHEMGNISNLITDMTIKNAPPDEIARAIKHSMVVIDANKHELNYKLSAEVNGIASLKRKYQGSAKSGASTLISRARSRIDVDDRKPRPYSEGGPIDRATGRKVFVETGKMRTTSTGKLVPVKVQSKKLAETDDAFTLSSGTTMEKIYAEHSNKLKSLANTARLATLSTTMPKVDASAKRTYASEVESLTAKLLLAQRNAPLERQAQVLAGVEIRAKKAAYPDLDRSSIKKIEYQAITKARNRTGAGKQRIVIEDNEWDAIQAGAISSSKLSKILANANLDRVRELATPKAAHLMTTAKTQRAKAMLDSGYTWEEVASSLGVSMSTLGEAIKE